MAHKKTKLHFIKSITQYGIHIWAILILANAALAYAFHFSTHASQGTQQQATIADDNLSVTPSETTDNPNLSPAPHGQLLDLNFTVPGIGSGGGTMTPKHFKRNVTVYLYAPDVNSNNNTVKPLYTIKTTADFEKDTNSPLYTTFGNHALDLGVNVKDGNYQISFRTDQSLRTLIKDNPAQVGGSIFNISKDSVTTLILPLQTVLMGDTVPKVTGDNVIDIADYNGFINCFGSRSTTDFCSQNNYGDFDDNGTIDGIDYNILLRTFQALLKQGQAIPQVSVTPSVPQRVSRLSNLGTPTPKLSVTKAPNIKSKPAEPVKPQGTGNVFGGILFFFFLIILGVFGFLFFKNEGFRNKVKAIIHLSPTGTPAEPKSEAETPAAEQPTEEAATEQTPTETATETTDAPADQPAAETPASEATPPAETPAADASPEDIAASTEIPIPAKDEEPKDAPAAAPATDGTIEKSCYIKKRLPDDAKTGFWLTLTDDNGAIEGHYTGKDVSDGFAKVKGVMKEADGKKFLEISELTPEG